jgi:two-component system NarL family sensor kinase
MRGLSAPASSGEAAAEAERVVAWLRLPAIVLFVLAQSLAHPHPQETEFHVALALYGVWSAAALAWVYLRPVGERLALAMTAADIAGISVLALLSGGAFSHARFAFFLVPVAAAFRFRPSLTAAAAVVATAAYVGQAIVDPARTYPNPGRFIATQAGFIAWVGFACALLSLLLARRTALASGFAGERLRLLEDALEAEQRERKRLAEALHDHALQNLLSARHELQEAEDVVVHPALVRADNAIAATVSELRDAVFELHPYVFEQAGLEAALRSIARHAAGRAGLELRLDLRYDNEHPREHLLFSAARELLSNVVRHAAATHVTVCLSEAHGVLRLVVEDDGRGFPPERPAEQLADGHVGLASQRIRIEAAGGRMDVTSVPGEGTRVEIRLPNPGDRARHHGAKARR